jgi:hypothetical protein
MNYLKSIKNIDYIVVEYRFDNNIKNDGGKDIFV